MQQQSEGERGVLRGVGGVEIFPLCHKTEFDQPRKGKLTAAEWLGGAHGRQPQPYA